ncbi:enoyl-CoA hydratase-related protein [Colwellia psychrerythraea]|uniref:Enoyl-CoA hydratase/isomerase family protein n=1 Tax=Colwellia psychrerythraea (strain 34H / ATCC BAA-681) TaxID=167879 RepID=Q488U1_COLP3|nr:enoyl-CoA hydratase-related protein [Colwellia psychrerythraea]AAZ25368.1 enoyl-CoA hydratase/isomerase family protein [Colwellia psychrerythraea 34H]
MNNLVLTEEHQGVLTITLNRSMKKNAINAAMYKSLCEHLTYANESAHIHCLLIQGDENCFTAGNDFAESGNEEELSAFVFIEQLATFSKPIVAAVAGPAVGIGTTLLLQCDMIIAANNSKFILPFAHLGICLEAGASLLLPLKVGLNRAFELAVLGAPFTAEQAYQYGIVNQVCQPNEVIAKALNVAQTIAKLPADSVQTSRRLMRQSTDKLMLDVINSEKSEVTRLLKTEYCQSMLTKFS